MLETSALKISSAQFQLYLAGVATIQRHEVVGTDDELHMRAMPSKAMCMPLLSAAVLHTVT